MQVLADGGFELEAGCIYDLIGPSGSGKSTLLRACALMLARQGGEFFLNGKASATFRPTAWRRRVCLVPQEPSLVPGTVRDNLVLPWTLKINGGENPPANELLADMLGMADLADIELDRDVSQLSGGQAARVALLRAFATAPDVLLLDEVDAALDAESSCAVGRMTRALVGDRTACLRIRHHAADGFAKGTFTLREGVLSYAENPDSSTLPCAAGFDPQAYASLAALRGESVGLSDGRSSAAEGSDGPQQAVSGSASSAQDGEGAAS